MSQRPTSEGKTAEPGAGGPQCPCSRESWGHLDILPTLWRPENFSDQFPLVSERAVLRRGSPLVPPSLASLSALHPALCGLGASPAVTDLPGRSRGLLRQGEHGPAPVAQAGSRPLFLLVLPFLSPLCFETQGSCSPDLVSAGHTSPGDGLLSLGAQGLWRSGKPRIRAGCDSPLAGSRRQQVASWLSPWPHQGDLEPARVPLVLVGWL